MVITTSKTGGAVDNEICCVQQLQSCSDQALESYGALMCTCVVNQRKGTQAGQRASLVGWYQRGAVVSELLLRHLPVAVRVYRVKDEGC